MTPSPFPSGVRHPLRSSLGDGTLKPSRAAASPFQVGAPQPDFRVAEELASLQQWLFADKQTLPEFRSGQTVLLLSNDPGGSALMQTLLRVLGHETRWCGDVQAAEAALMECSSVDLAVVDLHHSTRAGLASAVQMLSAFGVFQGLLVAHRSEKHKALGALARHGWRFLPRPAGVVQTLVTIYFMLHQHNGADQSAPHALSYYRDSHWGRDDERRIHPALSRAPERPLPIRENTARDAILLLGNDDSLLHTRTRILEHVGYRVTADRVPDRWRLPHLRNYRLVHICQSVDPAVAVNLAQQIHAAAPGTLVVYTEDETQANSQHFDAIFPALLHPRRFIEHIVGLLADPPLRA